ncbi:substrate-binding periplasmic protein [Undibacterium fentianense]|uniref:Transporter substrate-binding domain-containing protein n=1 Tax=Undibacterium fentianense TaxID=2828728 RepID=A0A941DYS3_9BURK|nr:transporter substrate-binding domain-containing protein [Undibacterium fentianense]MBR7799255.1 transporter substrate-binding domain-containing protein [Undibacterium fentianense]
MNVLIVVFTLFVCGFPQLTSAEIHIRTAAQESSEPKFIAIKSQGKPAISGICVDIFRSIEKRFPTIHFSGDQVWMPRRRMDLYFQDKRIDLICGVQDLPRNTAQYQLLSTVLFSVDYMLAVRADDPVQVKSWEEIRQLGDNGVILALQGFGIVDILQKIGGLKLDPSATSSLSNLRKLLAGRGRFYCHRSPGLKSSIQQAGLSREVRVLDHVFHTEKFYMGLRKDLPAFEVKMIQDALLDLSKSGELKRIFDRYRD